MSEPDLLDLKAEGDLFQFVSSYRVDFMAVGVKGIGKAARIASVSDGFFKCLGILPSYGVIDVDDDHFVFVSNRWWKQHLQSDTGVIGNVLTINQVPFVIRAILPEGFNGIVPDEYIDLWISDSARNGIEIATGALDLRTNRGARTKRDVIARTHRGASQKGIEQRLAKLSQVLQTEYPETNRNIEFRWESYSSYRLASIRRVIPNPATILAAGITILALVILNLACLHIIYGRARIGNLAIRMALGASFFEGIQTNIFEVFYIWLLGIGGGVAVSLLGAKAIFALAPIKDTSFIPVLAPNWTLITFLSVFSLLGTLAGVFPAIKMLCQVDLVSALGNGSKGSSRHGAKSLGMTIMIQFAVCISLLAGTLTAFASLQAGFNKPIGLNPEGLWTGYFEPGAQGKTPIEVQLLAKKAMDRALKIPEVRDACIMSYAPLQGKLTIVSIPHPSTGIIEFISVAQVSPGLIKTLGGTFVRGEDLKVGQQGCLICESLANHWWPGQDPVGVSINAYGKQLTIVGVFKNIPLASISATEMPTVLIPFELGNPSSFSILARGKGNLEVKLTAALNGIDAQVPTLGVRKFTDLLGAQLHYQRLGSWVLGVLTFATLVLTIIGSWGLGNLVIQERQQELNIRMALGATPNSLLQLVLMYISGWLVKGLVIGLLATLILGLCLTTRLYGFPSPPWVQLWLCSGLLFVASLLGAFFSVHRGVILDPSKLLG